MAEFLKDLPSHNRLNFKGVEPNVATRLSSVRNPPVYIQTKEYPEKQVQITTEKTNILLRYLQQQFDKKNKKREAAKGDVEESPTKMRRLSGS